MTRLRKGMALALCVMLMMALLPTVALAADIEMESGVPPLTVNSNTQTVGFGGYEWYVIGYDGTGVQFAANAVTLLAKDNSFGSTEFDTSVNRTSTSGGSVTTAYSRYEGSLLQAKMNAIYNGFAASGEQGLVNAVTIDDVNTDATGGYNIGTLPDQYVWPLSVIEANASVRPFGGYWWLRSPGNSAFVLVGEPSGYYFGDLNTVSSSLPVRPALQLNLSSVLFTSAAAGGQSKPTAVGASLSSAEPTTGAVKFTVQDSGQTLGLTATTAQSTQASVSAVEFGYSGATVGTEQWVSCYLVNQGSGDDYYAKLVQVGSSSEASGTLSIPLTGVADGTYTLQMFSEQDNGNNYTDFCSTPLTMTLTVVSGAGTVSNLDNNIAILSNNAGLASVAGQSITAGNEAGTDTAPKTASISVANSVAQVALSDIVAATGTTAELYSDSGFSQNKDAAIALTEGGATHAYIKVTAQDGTILHYDVTVNRAGATPTTYIITFDANGGTVTPATGTTGADGKLATLPTPAYNGYTFNGWFTAAIGGTQVTTSTVFAANDTIYAQWTQTQQPDPGPNYSWRTITDSATGVSVSGYFTASATLTVTQNALHTANTCPACDEIRAQQTAGNVLVLYDISVSGGYQGNLEVSIPVGATYNGQSLTVLHCNNRALEQKTITAQNGHVTGTWSGLSPFAVLKPLSDPVDTPDDDVQVPQTGDNSNMGLWVTMLFAALCFAGLAIWQLVKKRGAARR